MVRVPREKKIYQLTEGDRRVFEMARKQNNPSIITNYYLRTETSGTYWRPVLEEDLLELTIPQAKAAATRWLNGYEHLYDWWQKLGRPYYFAPDDKAPDRMIVLRESDFKSRRELLAVCYQLNEEDGQAVFYHPHGTMLLPWQLQMSANRSGVQVVIGGYGSGKTLGKIILMLVNGITLRNYAGLGLGPWSIQAKEIYALIEGLITGTEYEKRFLIRNASQPNPVYEFAHSGIGRTSIACYPILEDTEKLLSVTADNAVIDQIEQFDDIDAVIRIVSTRFRGQVQGRPRIGQMTLVANSADHPTLWDVYDEGQKENRHRWSISPTTFDNSYLTMADLVRYQKDVGETLEAIEVHMLGKRPVGGGENFPATSLKACQSEAYDKEIFEKVTEKAKGWKAVQAHRCDTHLFTSPRKDGETYLVTADPGWADPPERNSAIVGVWQVTGFPAAPAKLVAYHWVFGGNSPIPWIDAYKQFVFDYGALGFNGFDATGFQSGYEKMTDISDVQPTPVMLTDITKYRYLNLYKRWMAEGRFIIPTMFTHFYSQHAKYTLPDKKLRQDIVMMALVTVGILEPMSYTQKSRKFIDTVTNPNDRWSPVTESGMYEDRY